MENNIIINLEDKYFDKEDLFKMVSKYGISEKDFKHYISLIKFNGIEPIVVYRLINYRYPELSIRTWERIVRRYNLVYKVAPIKKYKTINVRYFEDKDISFVSRYFVVKNTEK